MCPRFKGNEDCKSLEIRLNVSGREIICKSVFETKYKTKNNEHIFRRKLIPYDEHQIVDFFRCIHPQLGDIDCSSVDGVGENPLQVSQGQRLTLMRHASKCLSEKGCCHTTMYCWGIKMVWKHITICRNDVCRVRFCLSCKSLLAHFRKCENLNCYVCKPVREAIKLNIARHIKI